MKAESESFVVLSINHEIAPMDVRERYSIDNAMVDTLYSQLHQQLRVSESLVLNTCNRFELYSQLENGTSKEDLINLLSNFYQEDRQKVEEFLHLRSGQEAVQHLIEVSAGLRSQITGEAEIFGQVKDAYAVSLHRGYAGKVINRVFQKAFQAAKLIRNSTSVGEGQINIANVAVELANKIFGNLESAAVLSLGTGEIGEKTVKALKSRGAKQFGIVSRSEDRAKEAALAWGGTPHLLSDLDSYLVDYDIVIASIGTEDTIISKSLIRKCALKRGSPLFLIDLGLPRNIEKGCDDFDSVFQYNLDDLAAIAEENLTQRKLAVEHSQSIALQKAQHIWESIIKRGLAE